MDDQDVASEIVALRPFVPATDFEASLRFYEDLGFAAFRLGDGLASMRLGRFCFLLQAFDREGFATNFMMHLLVNHVEAWWSRIEALDLVARHAVRPPAPPQRQPWGLIVAYVFDPSGVLWHIAEDRK